MSSNTQKSQVQRESAMTPTKGDIVSPLVPRFQYALSHPLRQAAAGYALLIERERSAVAATPSEADGPADSEETSSPECAVIETLQKPVIILVGHFGSGKSEIAINLACRFRAGGEAVALVDLDLVKPYFRSRIARDELDARGIRLVVPQGDHFYADLPIVVPEIRGALSKAATTGRVIVDMGGDDTGARVIGSLGAVVESHRTDVLFVVNTNRPFAENPPAIRKMLHEIETATRLKVTGLVSNSHLMEETTPEVISEGIGIARLVSDSTGIPIRFYAALNRLQSGIASCRNLAGSYPLLPLERRILPFFAARPSGSRRRSVVI